MRIFERVMVMRMVVSIGDLRDEEWRVVNPERDPKGIARNRSPEPGPAGLPSNIAALKVN